MISRSCRHSAIRRMASAPAARASHLVLVDDEVLAQHRQRHRVADGVDVGEVAAEELAVGEAADRGRSRFPVTSGDGHRIEVLADDPRGRALLLHLGDDAHGVGVPVVDHVAEEVARAAELGDALLEHFERHGTAGVRHLAVLVLDDVLEDGDHRSDGGGLAGRHGTRRGSRGRGDTVYACGGWVDAGALVRAGRGSGGGRAARRVVPCHAAHRARVDAARRAEHLRVCGGVPGGGGRRIDCGDGVCAGRSRGAAADGGGEIGAGACRADCRGGVPLHRAAVPAAWRTRRWRAAACTSTRAVRSSRW